LIFSFLIVCESFGQCPPPILVASTTTTANGIATYTITNYNPLLTYTWTITNSVGSSFNPTPTTNTFSYLFPNRFDSYMIVVTVSGPSCTTTNNADTVYTYRWCDNPTVTNIIDGTNNNITATNNSTYLIMGTLTINSSITLTGCTLLMSPGSEIICTNGATLALVNSTVSAGCGMMWKGISLINQGGLKLENQSVVRDAQYAINLINPSSLDLEGGSILQNNYVGIYSPSKPTPITMPTNYVRENFTITGGITVTPFHFQNPAPISNTPFAGIELNDVNNFNLTIPSGFIFSIINLNAGAIIKRGTATFRNVRFNQIFTNGNYSNTRLFPASGSAIYGSSSGNRNTTLTIGGTSNNDICTFTNGNWGIKLNGATQATIINNEIGNFTNAILINRCRNLPQTITGNRISEFLTGIVIRDNPSPLSEINISNNRLLNFNFTTSADIPAIWYNNLSASAVNLKILNNVINNTTNTYKGINLGIRLTNVNMPINSDVSTMPTIRNNIIYFDQLIFDFNTKIHRGIILDRCRSILVENNLISRTGGALISNIVPNPQQRLYGIDATLTANTTIKSNTIVTMGSTMRFTQSCLGTQLYCNSQFSSNRGIFINGATMTEQGSANSSNDNTWSNFGNVLRVYGVVPFNPAIWHFQQFGSLSVVPYSQAAISGNPIGVSNSTLCSNTNPPPDFILREDSTFQSIVEDNIYYPIYPINNVEIAKNQTFYLLEQEAQLQALEEGNQNFYDNYDLTPGAELGEISELISDGNYSNAQLRMEALSNLSEMQNNLLFTLQVIVNMNTIENYEISESDHQRLLLLATTSVFQQGDAVINARAILELTINDRYAFAARLGDEFSNDKNCLQSETIGNTLYFNSNCDEKIRSVLVYDEIGKLVFETTNSYLELTKLKQGFNVLHINTNRNSYAIKKIVR
jgi:hypothetical protein